MREGYGNEKNDERGVEGSDVYSFIYIYKHVGMHQASFWYSYRQVGHIPQKQIYELHVGSL